MRTVSSDPCSSPLDSVSIRATAPVTTSSTAVLGDTLAARLNLAPGRSAFERPAIARESSQAVVDQKSEPERAAEHTTSVAETRLTSLRGANVPQVVVVLLIGRAALGCGTFRRARQQSACRRLRTAFR